jgi:uncharacterized protein (DUF2252 family)
MEGTREDRLAAGRALREAVPRSAHGEWAAPNGRRDPIDVLLEQGSTRVSELVPVRFDRMIVSPFAFLRGSAAVMAMDLASTPVTGLRVQACGDAHVGNFGGFATPERGVVFDINDFDETLPAPWEWDVKRLAASLQVVARERGFDAAACDRVVLTAVRTYRERMSSYAGLRTLGLWYARIAIDEAIAHFPRKYRPLAEQRVAKARRKTSGRAVSRLTEVVDGHLRFVEAPPLIVRLENTPHALAEAAQFIEGHRQSLSDDHRALFDRFRLVDVARKVVGVGSVGTWCWVALLEGPDHPAGDPLVMQVKEAQESVLEPYAGPSALGHHGLRVVAGQRLTQAASDIFLGWSEGPMSGRHYYLRQLWDVKGQGDLSVMDVSLLSYYGALCAWALARAHARTGDPVMLSGYLGSSKKFDRAIVRFASVYADQTERDHAVLVEAARDGRVPLTGEAA